MSYGIAKVSRAAVWLVAFLLTLLTITVHVVSPSTWRFSDQRWEEILRLRQESPIFGVRPITAICVKVISGVTGLSVKSAFFTLQFLLYFLTGPAFYYYLRRLRFDKRYALGGMIVFLSSLPLFMAHFEPIFTWSDFWIYLLVPLSFAPACERRYGLSVACMAIALLARETTLLMLPWIYFFAQSGRPSSKLSAAVAVTASLLLFFAIRFLVFGPGFPSPNMKLVFNFENAVRTRDTLFSVFVSLGFVWVVGLTHAFLQLRTGETTRRTLAWGGVVVSLGYLSSGLLFGQARASRLFAPAAIFLVPLTLDYVRHNAQSIRSSLKPLIRRWWLGSITVILVVGGATVLGKILVPSFEYRAWHDGNWGYLGVNLALVAAFIYFDVRRSRGLSS